MDSEATYEDPSIPYEKFEEIHGHYDHCRSCGLDYFERFEEVGFKTQTLKVSQLNTDEQKNTDYLNTTWPGVFKKTK